MAVTVKVCDQHIAPVLLERDVWSLEVHVAKLREIVSQPEIDREALEYLVWLIELDVGFLRKNLKRAFDIRKEGAGNA